MNLRFAWGASALLVWMGCGGAFTTVDPGDDAGTGSGTTTGSAGSIATGGVGGSSSGTGGSSSGTGGSSSGTGGTISGTGGTIGGTGGSSTGAGGGSAGTGGSVGTGGGGGSGPDWNSCDGPGQCVALATSCCGACGGDVSAYSGVNTKRVQDFHTQLCPNPVACPAIACVQTTNPNNIAARCVSGHCQAFDVTKVPEYSSCTDTTDCVLRDGLGCCVCGATAGWVAVSKSGDQAIAKAECAPDTACLDCQPVPPTRTLASCTNHVCTVLLAP